VKVNEGKEAESRGQGTGKATASCRITQRINDSSLYYDRKHWPSFIRVVVVVVVVVKTIRLAHFCQPKDDGKSKREMK